MEAVGAQQVDVAEFTVLDAVEEFAAGAAVAAHEANADLEILLLGQVVEGEHAPGGGAVRAERLLHENIQPLVDGFFVMHPAEGAGRGEDDDVAPIQVVHRLGVAVKTDVAAIGRHVHAVLVAVFQRFVAVVHLCGGDIGHRDEFVAGDVTGN